MENDEDAKCPGTNKPGKVAWFKDLLGTKQFEVQVFEVKGVTVAPVMPDSPLGKFVKKIMSQLMGMQNQPDDLPTVPCQCRNCRMRAALPGTE